MVSNTELHMSTPTAAEMKKKRGEEYEFGGPVGEQTRIATHVSGQKLAQPSTGCNVTLLGTVHFTLYACNVTGLRASNCHTCNGSVSHMQWQRARRKIVDDAAGMLTSRRIGR
jgi:hypothetical protein